MVSSVLKTGTYGEIEVGEQLLIDGTPAGFFSNPVFANKVSLAKRRRQHEREAEAAAGQRDPEPAAASAANEELNFSEVCPACGKELFSDKFPRPNPKWQFQGKILVLLGGIISGCLVVLAFFLVALLVAELAERLGLKRTELGLLVFVGWALAGLVALIPALVLGRIAFGLPRALKLTCRRCGWTQTSLMSARKGRPDERPQ
jgi:ribosomal protein L44E